MRRFALCIPDESDGTRAFQPCSDRRWQVAGTAGHPYLVFRSLAFQPRHGPGGGRAATEPHNGGAARRSLCSGNGSAGQRDMEMWGVPRQAQGCWCQTSGPRPGPGIVTGGDTSCGTAAHEPTEPVVSRGMASLLASRGRYQSGMLKRGEAVSEWEVIGSGSVAGVQAQGELREVWGDAPPSTTQATGDAGQKPLDGGDHRLSDVIERGGCGNVRRSSVARGPLVQMPHTGFRAVGVGAGSPAPPLAETSVRCRRLTHHRHC